jgi:regulatory protein
LDKGPPIKPKPSPYEEQKLIPDDKNDCPEEIKKSDDVQLAFSKSLHYLKFRSRSKAEITRYLEKKGFDARIIASAINKLENYKYVDDTAFARLWVENRISHKPKGLFALRYELKEKGIDEGIIETALSCYDELEPAWRAVSAKLGSWSTLPDFELKVKIYNFLRQRGFAFETCEKIYARAAGNF